MPKEQNNYKTELQIIKLLPRLLDTDLTRDEIGKELDISRPSTYNFEERLQEAFPNAVTWEKKGKGPEKLKLRANSLKTLFKKLFNPFEWELADLMNEPDWLPKTYVQEFRNFKAKLASLATANREGQVPAAQVFYQSLVGQELLDEGADQTLNLNDIETLIEAIRTRHACEIEYTHRNGSTYLQDIWPIFFFRKDGRFRLLAAIDEEFEELRTFRPAAIEYVELYKDWNFELPENDVARFREIVDSALGVFYGDHMNVVIRFKSSLYDYITERKWSPNQTIETQPDGSHVLKMTVSGDEDLERWIRGLGPDAELLEPADLREKLAESARAMAKIYGDPHEIQR